jgi:hypothetical protein
MLSFLSQKNSDYTTPRHDFYDASRVAASCPGASPKSENSRNSGGAQGNQPRNEKRNDQSQFFSASAHRFDACFLSREALAA